MMAASAVVLVGVLLGTNPLEQIAAHEAGGDPERVRGLGARFAALVTLPSRIVVRILAREPAEDGAVRVRFEVRNAAGEPAIRDGWVRLR